MLGESGWGAEDGVAGAAFGRKCEGAEREFAALCQILCSRLGESGVGELQGEEMQEGLGEGVVVVGLADAVGADVRTGREGAIGFDVDLDPFVDAGADDGSDEAFLLLDPVSVAGDVAAPAETGHLAFERDVPECVAFLDGLVQVVEVRLVAVLEDPDFDGAEVDELQLGEIVWDVHC